MIHFQGTELLQIPPAEAAAKLSDAGFLATCVPDATVTVAEPDRAAWTVKPKLAFISGHLDTALKVIDRATGESATFEVVGKGVGASSTVSAKLTFIPEGPGTRVEWTGDIVALTGLLKMVPKGLVQAAAEKVIAEVWDGIRAKLAGPA